MRKYGQFFFCLREGQGRTIVWLSSEDIGANLNMVEGGAKNVAASKPATSESSPVPAAKEVPAAKKNGTSNTPTAQHEKDKEGPCGLPSKCVVQ